MTTATLGFAIDSSQAKTAATDLDKLTVSSGKAEASAKTLGATNTTASKAAQTLASEVKKADEAHKGMSSQAMAAQHAMRGFFEQMAMGVPPTQAFASHLNQLSYAASGPGGLSSAFSGALGAMRSLLSPMTLVVGGIAAIIGVSYLAYSSVSKMQKALSDAADSAGTTAAQFHLLQSAAEFKGIAGSDFVGAMEKFSGSVYEAKNNMGELGVLLRSNGKSTKDFQDAFGNVADLVQRAATSQEKQQILMRAGLPATMDWVRYMSQGAEGVRKATEEATKLSPAQKELVDGARRFDEAWDTAWKNFKSAAANAVMWVKSELSSAPFMPSGGLIFNGRHYPAADSQMSRDAGSNDIPNITISKQPKTIDPNVLNDQISKQQQLLGLYGQTTTAQEAVRAVELQVQTMRLSGISVDQKRVDILKQLAKEQNLGITAIKASADAAKVEGETIGMNVGETAKYTAIQNELNKAIRDGSDNYNRNTDAGRQNYQMLVENADALGKEAQRTDDAKFSFDTFKGTVSTFVSELRNGATVWEAFGKAAQSALNKIADKLMDMALNSLWKSAFPGGGGGFLSLFTGGGSGGAGGGMGINLTGTGGLYANGGIRGPLGDVPLKTYAGGGIANSPQMSIFGEGSTPEAYVPLPDGRRIPVNMNVGNMGGGGQIINVTHAPVYNVQGTSQELQDVRKQADEDRRSFDQRVSGLIAAPNSKTRGSLHANTTAAPRRA